MSVSDTFKRSAKVAEIAQRVRESGTVYDRLPEAVITRVRKFKHLTPAPVKTGPVDMTRTYGFIEKPTRR